MYDNCKEYVHVMKFALAQCLLINTISTGYRMLLLYMVHMYVFMIQQSYYPGIIGIE